MSPSEEKKEEKEISSLDEVKLLKSKVAKESKESGDAAYWASQKLEQAQMYLEGKLPGTEKPKGK